MRILFIMLDKSIKYVQYLTVFRRVKDVCTMDMYVHLFDNKPIAPKTSHLIVVHVKVQTVTYNLYMVQLAPTCGSTCPASGVKVGVWKLPKCFNRALT